ncbi:hypothetical protein NKR23_g11185 [Pleurostoma richardsiae]|uniref:Developmental regulator protein n=1 Tax=Pleurostoma richardsiae TaxID=41990 RepID=A0AA38VDP8_9PEZI|nr:hypothetical protein NKR23_g11185 [Pleurostoma richardsiae]
MPTYLCHGFRWHRQSIRVYVVVQNLDDAAPEWVVRPASANALLGSFYDLFDFLPYCAPPGSLDPDDPDRDPSSRSRSRSHGASSSAAAQQQHHKDRRASSSKRGRSESRRKAPPPSLPLAPPPPPPLQPGAASAGGQLDRPGDELLAQSWSAVKLLEEYDPLDLAEASRPHAFVADYVVRIDLSCGVADEIARYEELVRGAAYPPVAAAAGQQWSSEEGSLRGGGGGSGSSSRRDGGKGKKGGAPAGSGWLEKLRDQLQMGEDIRWYVIVNGDEERAWPGEEDAGRGRGGSQAAAAQQQVLGDTDSGVQDRDKEAERERQRETLRREMGLFNEGPAPPPQPPNRRIRGEKERERRPPVPDKLPVPDQLPTPIAKVPTNQAGGARPKTPKGGGFRRLFGRSKSGNQSTT